VPGEQNVRIVEANGAILRIEPERALEQEFGIVEHIELRADMCKQPHAFDVIWLRLQKLPNHRFSVIGLAFGEQMSGAHDGRRQTRQRNHLGRCGIRLLLPADRLQQITQCRPAGTQRGIAGNGLLIGLDRRLGLTDGAITMSAFLIEPAEVRVHLFETNERAEGISDAAQIPLADGHQIQDVPVLRHLCEKCLRDAQRLGKLLALNEGPRVADLALDPRRPSVRVIRLLRIYS
jgi:hypothetical protein